MPKTTPKKLTYRILGKTSDGVRVLKPVAATSKLSPVGVKIARAMAARRSPTSRPTKGKPAAATKNTASAK